MSSAPASVAPIRNASSAASGGAWRRLLIVVTSTSETSSGGSPASPSALPAAAAAMSSRVSPGPAYPRLVMPERLTIHSSLDPIGAATSSLPTERDGR